MKYNENRNQRSGSQGRDNYTKNWRDSKGRSRSNRNRFNNNRRSSSRGKRPDERRTGWRKQSPKLTYHCVNLKIDRNRTIFEIEVENKAFIDSGCCWKRMNKNI